MNIQRGVGYAQRDVQTTLNAEKNGSVYWKRGSVNGRGC